MPIKFKNKIGNNSLQLSIQAYSSLQYYFIKSSNSTLSIKIRTNIPVVHD